MSRGHAKKFANFLSTGIQMIVELNRQEIEQVSGAGLTGTVAGTLGGTVAGQAIGPEVGAGFGAAVGSFLPGIGTLGGAIIGAGLGTMYGGLAGGAAGAYVLDKLQDHGWAYFFPNGAPTFNELLQFTDQLQ
ncbi:MULTISPECIES: hypothetical protein [Paraburkholderia]|uniref:Outer membrane protein with glycine zipper n=2 Tax=Paraburkholderia TaxID=1822464 RepID=A0A7Y9WAX1_9BURK|nr:hypothetical protein [Paraburkholderia bryophila]NYH16948.1 hypothetical protein [Paraburkholderia bryophila]NYH27746.1 hypothetical protein [Paraburkholderia bryophila]